VTEDGQLSQIAASPPNTASAIRPGDHSPGQVDTTLMMAYDDDDDDNNNYYYNNSNNNNNYYYNYKRTTKLSHNFVDSHLFR
jgi:hypothetical protein